MPKLLVLVLTFIFCVSSAEKSGESGKYRHIPVENLHDTSIYTSIAKLEQFFMEEVINNSVLSSIYLSISIQEL